MFSLRDGRGVLAAMALAVVIAVGGACAREAPSRAAPAAQPSPASATAVAPAPAPDPAGPKIVVLGDSLTAGLGLAPSQAYTALLQQKLDAAGAKWEVVNAGVSGDTSAAGLERADWALDQGHVRILVLELGANDGLRGLPPAELQKNLAAIIARAQSKGIAVLLAGMEAPPNFGPDYTVSFRQVYRDLARQYKIPLIPFLLDNVAGVPSLNQGDGIHPNVQGEQIVADTVWAALKPMVDRAPAQ
jgi:acyl-CoA thioesterase-1